MEDRVSSDEPPPSEGALRLHHCLMTLQRENPELFRRFIQGDPAIATLMHSPTLLERHLQSRSRTLEHAFADLPPTVARRIVDRQKAEAREQYLSPSSPFSLTSGVTVDPFPIPGGHGGDSASSPDGEAKVYDFAGRDAELVRQIERGNALFRGQQYVEAYACFQSALVQYHIYGISEKLHANRDRFQLARLLSNRSFCSHRMAVSSSSTDSSERIFHLIRAVDDAWQGMRLVWVESEVSTITKEAYRIGLKCARRQILCLKELKLWDVAIAAINEEIAPFMEKCRIGGVRGFSIRDVRKELASLKRKHEAVFQERGFRDGEQIAVRMAERDLEGIRDAKKEKAEIIANVLLYPDAVPKQFFEAIPERVTNPEEDPVTARLLSTMYCQENREDPKNVRACLIPGKGRGLVATRQFSRGDLLFVDQNCPFTCVIDADLCDICGRTGNSSEKMETCPKCHLKFCVGVCRSLACYHDILCATGDLRVAREEILGLSHNSEIELVILTQKMLGDCLRRPCYPQLHVLEWFPGNFLHIPPGGEPKSSIRRSILLHKTVLNQLGLFGYPHVDFGSVNALSRGIKANSRAMSTTTSGRISVAVLPNSCLFNHSCCDENVTSSTNITTTRQQEGVYPDRRLLVAWIALKDIQEGEELLISYRDAEDHPRERMEGLKRTYGFDCMCRICVAQRSLSECCERGDLAALEQLVDSGAVIEGEKALLGVAAKNGHANVVRWLAERGLDIRENRSHAELALQEALEAKSFAVVRVLLEHGAPADLEDNWGVLVASESGSLNTVRCFVEFGADPQARDGAPLIIASQNGHLGVVSFLVAECHVDVHAQEDHAIVVACRAGYLEIVKCLVEHQADPHARKDLPLCAALVAGQIEIVQYLFELGGIDPKCYRNSLVRACATGNLELVKWIHAIPEVGAHFPNARGEMMMIAQRGGNEDVFQWILEKGGTMDEMEISQRVWIQRGMQKLKSGATLDDCFPD